MPEEEWRGVTYLLAELARWEAQGIIGGEQAARLRQRYEGRREELRGVIESDGKKRPGSAPLSSPAREPEAGAPTAAGSTPYTQATVPTPHAGASEAATPDYSVAAAFSQFLSTSPPPSTKQPPRPSSDLFEPTPRRTLIETLSDPYIIRLLSFIGASMLVVGVVIWLKDILYLKLREPVVQASLLALGTLSVTVTGWYLILRTRQKLTGRALTLIGSVLVPINFWFLVRSGLISNNGRAWVVCALCAMLYAHTAALLRERLYVYLACIATISTAWALVYRTTPEAFGLYALTLTGASLVFLHLSRLFPILRESRKDGFEPAGDDEEERESVDNTPPYRSRLSYDLWGPPLVRVALAGCALSALLYMPLRLWPSPSLYDGIFRLRASDYDASVGILLYAAAAYICWFTGRYIYTDLRVLFYTLSTLALFWTALLALDGFRLPGSVHLLALAGCTLVVAIAARRAREAEAGRAFHLAGVVMSLALAVASFSLLLATGSYTLTLSAGLACLSLSFALLSTPRFSEILAQAALAHASAIFASLAYLTLLATLPVRSEVLYVAACAAWPFALYACAQFARRRFSEAQLTAPFLRIADAEFVILLLYASLLALLLHDRTIAASRPSMFCALAAAILYGTLRSRRERSAFGATLLSLAALIMTAAGLDSLKMAGLWPSAWPVAAGVICAAFLLRSFVPGLLHEDGEGKVAGARPLGRVVRFVTDSTVLICALMWFVVAISGTDYRGFGAAFVIGLALLYWFERAARSHLVRHTHLATAHLGALFITLLIALRIDTQWFALLLALVLFPIFFAAGARAREANWVVLPASLAAAATLALASLLALAHAAPHLQAGDPLLLAPSVSMGAIALASFCASLLSTAHARVAYFRAGLSATVVGFVLACLRAGYDPVSDIEIYTSPMAVLLLAIAYLSARRAWEEYDRDTDILLWLGSLLLAMPLLFHALYFRLLLDVPAPGRDIATLCASLALILFSLFGRLRAPMMVGVFALGLELAALTLTSVNWLQVPVKYYLITIGALIVILVWAFEYRREQILLARQRFNEHRAYARERFGEWR
jgi:hypothetical protein